MPSAASARARASAPSGTKMHESASGDSRAPARQVPRALARREACEATQVRGEQDEATLDRRMACLQRAGRALDRVVGVLRNADADTADVFTEVSREIDKLLWFVEAHLQGDR